MVMIDSTGRVAEIEIRKWNCSGWEPDWSEDFFNAGLLEFDEAKCRYEVDDIDYCIEQALDMIHHVGDYVDDMEIDHDMYLIVDGEAKQ